MMKDIYSSDWAGAILSTCASLIFFALILEHVYYMEPCPLCMMQRVWFYLAGFTALLGLLHNPRIIIYPLLTVTCVLIGGYFSIKQVWLQSLPPDQVPACGPGLEYMIDRFPFSEVLRAMTTGTGDCAEVVWRFLGLSIPGWALVGFLWLLVLAVLQIRARHNG